MVQPQSKEGPRPDRFALSFFLLLLATTLSAQSPLQYWAQLELAAGTYFEQAAPQPLQHLAISPVLSGGISYPVQPWAQGRLGLAYTYTQQTQPTFTNRFHWVGVPISIVLWPWPDEDRKIRPILRSQYQAGWLIRAIHEGPTILELYRHTHRYRGEWSIMPGLAVRVGARTCEVGLFAALSNPVNDIAYRDETLPALLGSRWGLMLGTQL